MNAFLHTFLSYIALILCESVEYHNTNDLTIVRFLNHRIFLKNILYICKYFKLYVCIYNVYMCICVCVHLFMCSQMPEDAVTSLGTGITGGCMLPDLGGDNWTIVF